MGTVFVAYGDPDSRVQVLEFALERAAASGDDLLVYHVSESPEDSPEDLRAEVEAVVQRTAPEVSVDVRIEGPAEYSDDENVSKRKRLTDAILGGEGDYEYVVMGNISHGTIEELTLPSMTEAVLETHAVPVLLVPIRP